MATILVLEDEPGLLAVLRTVLTREAHQVLEATDAQRALEICDDAGEHIDVIIADVMARGPFAGTTAQAMFAARPGVPILLVSGYRLEDLLERQFISPQNLALGKVRFLQKPFRPDVLRDEV